MIINKIINKIIIKMNNKINNIQVFKNQIYLINIIVIKYQMIKII